MFEKLFCHHSYEFIKAVKVFENDKSTRPLKIKYYSICKKCGKVYVIALK